MLLLLPPSETKRDGGDEAPLDASRLRFPALGASRVELVQAVVSLASDDAATIAALKLGPKQHGEIARNRALTTSATMPAIDRYTGVLYDALDASTLTDDARAFAAEHLVIQSALLGPIGGLDPVPAYRLSHDSRVPGIVLRRHWATDAAAELASRSGLLLDLRSEGYAALAPLPVRRDAVFLRVLTEAADGKRRALNHFNKQAKGRFTRAVLEAGVDFGTAEELLEWGSDAGWRLEWHTADGVRPASGPEELALIV